MGKRNREVIVLDIGAGLNFVLRTELPPTFQHTRSVGALLNVRDVNGRGLQWGALKLYVQLSHSLTKVEFIVWDRLAAPVTLGQDFCNRIVEAIKP